MQQIYIDNEQLDIDFILQRQWGRYAELLLGTCGITDRYGVRQYYFFSTDNTKYYYSPTVELLFASPCSKIL